MVKAAAGVAPCTSPELLARGPVTALYCTHGGLWYDQKVTTGGNHSSNATYLTHVFFFKSGE